MAHFGVGGPNSPPSEGEGTRGLRTLGGGVTYERWFRGRAASKIGGGQVVCCGGGGASVEDRVEGWRAFVGSLGPRALALLFPEVTWRFASCRGRQWIPGDGQAHASAGRGVH